ncbi:gamma-tubulin complex component 5 [Zeugodacus cucurbitae]|uniref:gamma-tubulin complex component 5 n=1 Tax=Zeugodacus cucurbitae TaxID=28588 RepID=UPI0023D93D4D|nr:gamma-tubulin complex component 5 [Zeugodacus cucurbitae]
MSVQELRNEIIRENIPLLIKELTGFADDDENLRSYEQMAWSVIRNHRNLSTNSHEVRRRIEGLQEKFAVDNNLEYAEHLGRLCDEIIQHPLCKEHYEVDIEWSLLDFLISLAHNPTGALRRNKEKIDKLLKEHDELMREKTAENDSEYWKKVLQEDFIPLERSYSSSSELSYWSDATLEELMGLYEDSEIGSLSLPSRSHTPTPPPGMENIKPPRRIFPYTRYNNTLVEERLLNTVQNSWWEKGARIVQPTIESTNREANFALEYHKLHAAPTNQRKRDPPETATEYSLLREIFWMFQVPHTCKFFQVTGESIKIRKNVTLTSIRSIALCSMLENHFLPYIRMMQELRNFSKLIYGSDDYTPPNTLEHYAASLELLLEPIWHELLACERDLLTQPDCEINTLISIHNKLRPTFAKLSHLHNIHQQAVLNIRQLPAHISSTHLLAALIHCNRTATTAIEANLAMSLFLASVRVFLAIADTWWTEGRLDDWHNEFVIERVNESGQSIRVREFYKNKEKAFFVPTQVSKMITENSFFQLLLEHSLEAGCTLNLLYEINRIGELRSACDAIEGKLYNVFIEDVLKYVRILQKQITEAAREAKENDRLEIESIEICNNVDEVDELAGVEVVNDTVVQDTTNVCNEDDQILKKLTTNDDFLLLAFTMNMDLGDSESATADQCDTHTKTTTKNEESTALEIFEQFQQSKNILPLEEVILNALSRILKTRIAFANSFVMRLYREEFDILKHLRNIRKIYLLEASDIMHQFYSKLFKQIESGEGWANAFLLTTQLDDIICAKFSDMSSLFRVEIYSAYRSRTVKVHEAVDELSLSYNLSTELAHMIKPTDLEAYNKVFRFLLKVKWGLTTLENLQFPRAHKRRRPYAPYEMADLLMRRLEQLRFWMLFAIQSIHFHLMTHVLQSMGEQLDDKIAKCTNLKEMVTVHRSYMNTVCEHCFLAENFSSLKLGVEQLLNLTYILRLEWNSCANHIELKRNPWAAVDMNESVEDYLAHTQIDAIELTYIRCHQYLANKLNNEVYIKNNSFLLGLSTAFNTSLPY